MESHLMVAYLHFVIAGALASNSLFMMGMVSGYAKKDFQQASLPGGQ